MARPVMANVTMAPRKGERCGSKRDVIRAVNGELQRMGKGIHRVGYADDRKRYCYKVETSLGRLENANSEEYECMTNLRNSSDPRRMYATVCNLWYYTDPFGTTHTVLVMPFIAHDSSKADPKHVARARKRGFFRVRDMHGNNWRVTANGRMKFTDLGFGEL